MTVALVDQSPSDYVQHLTVSGLETPVGPARLNRYVSGVEPGRAAACFLALQNLVEHPTAATGHPAEQALLRLSGELESAVSGGWRRLFTGQAAESHLRAMWELLIVHREFFATFGEGRPFAPYFSGSGHPIETMVDDGLFGYDCLGFVGSYLHWVGLWPRVPTCEVPRYSHFLRLVPVEQLTDLRPLTVLYWSGTATQHIAIIDRVHDADRNHALVDLCQSSSGGPQLNERVRIGRNGDHRATIGATEYKKFAIRESGTPACPVMGFVVAAQRASWRLSGHESVAEATPAP